MLTRTTLGLLGRDHFNRADGTLGAEWDIVVGAGAWSIEGQAAKVVGANEHRRARLNTVAARMAMVVQARIKNTSPDMNSAPGLLARWDEAGGHRYIATFSHNNGRKEFQFFRFTGGVETPLAGVAFAWTTNGFNTMKLLIENGLQVGWADGAERFRLNDAALDAVLGNAGFFNWSGGAFVSYYDDFIVCADNAVVVTGLPAGYKVRVGSLVAAEVGGTATLDLAGTTLPAALLEVLDGSDNVVDIFTGDVWGGDEFLFDPMLTRPVSGLIFRETFDDIAVGSLPSGWTQVNEDASPTFSVRAAPVGMSGRALRAVLSSGGGQSGYVRDDTSGIADGVIQAKVMAQLTGSYNIQPSLNARFADNANQLYGRAEHFLSEGGATLTEISAGTSVSARHRVILTPGTAYRLILRVVGNQGGVWIRNPDGTLKASVSKELTRLAAGKWGVRWVGVSTNSIWWDDVALYRDSTIKVQGLPAGSKVRIGFLEAVENAGEAMLDFTGLYMDVSTLEVLDAGGNVLASFTFPGGIWGGDAFSYGVTTLPTQPTCFVQGVTATTAILVSSDFSSSDPGRTHTASRWQVDAQTGDFSAPLFDSGEDAAHLLSIGAAGLPQATPLQARVQHKDSAGAWSAWSDPVPFTTRGVVDTWHPCGVRPATAWESCDGAGVPESDIRERQPEFATPTHEVVGASIIRRPDAISLDYLVAHTLGPIAVADPSRGLVARVWKAWTPDGYEVRLAGANGAGDAWTDEVLLFTIDDGEPPILELDIAFEQTGQPVVCLERATGVGGASEVWIWFYDPTVPGMVLRNFGAGRTPRALLDRPLDVADSDVCVSYVADHLGRIAYRQQRDRYAVEILTPIEATEDTCLEDAAKMQDRRVVLILSERDPISGTYSLRTAATTLSPLAADTEAIEPIHGITTATLEQVFRWLDTQMHPEAIGPVHSLVSARLQELIIIYALAGEAIEPAHSLTGITLRDLIRLYTATTEAVAPAHMIAHATLVVAITIDRVLDTEAVEPAHTITSIELQAA